MPRAPGHLTAPSVKWRSRTQGPMSAARGPKQGPEDLRSNRFPRSAETGSTAPLRTPQPAPLGRNAQKKGLRGAERNAPSSLFT